ncbi:hypothetical protein AAIH63_35845, partial [Pseudomonas aeruginosa]
DDPRNIKLLTGIQDNNNRRFATWAYDKEQRLTSVTRTDGQYNTKTQYLYDDPRNIKLLTGIQDNNNRRFATWAYDNQGRGDYCYPGCL